MRALKIGILTFHRCINYGSFWQATCLAEGLQSKGHNAEILDHFSQRVNFAEFKCAYRPTLPLHTPVADYPLYRKKIEGFFQAFESMPLSAPFSLYEPEKMGEYDLVVVGSDEVWNLFHPWYGRCPLFYGEGVRADRLISYAASFGNYDASWQLESSWKERLLNFDRISVRDENSAEIIRTAMGLDVPLVLDPCLQFEVNPEPRDLGHLPGTYVAVYGHNISPWFTTRVREWADARGLPLVSIGYRNDWAHDQWLTADPHDFAHFIAGAAAVVTNFFHGCVFAMRNMKPFVCETSYYRSNKVQGLVTKTGSQHHLVSPQTTKEMFESLLEQPLDQRILERIAGLRETSGAYLDEALLPAKYRQYERTA